MAFRSQAAAGLPPRDREQELLRAEQEVQSLETQLATEIARVQGLAQQLHSRVTELTASIERADGLGADVSGVRARIEGFQMEPLDIGRLQEKSLQARAEAVSARKKAADGVKQGVEGFQTRLRAASQQMERDAGALAQLETDARAAASRRAEEPQAAPVAPVRAPLAPKVVAPPRLPVAGVAAAPRRDQQRVQMQAVVDLSSDSNFFTGFSTNISEGGLFVATIHSLPRGTPVELVFSIPGGGKINVRGVVRWTREVNDKEPSIFPGVGVQFLDLSPETVAAISGFVTSREPLFFPD